MKLFRSITLLLAALVALTCRQASAQTPQRPPLPENVERIAATLKQRGVPAEYHGIKGITHYGVYREGFAEATRVELDWFNQHLKASATP